MAETINSPVVTIFRCTAIQYKTRGIDEVIKRSEKDAIRWAEEFIAQADNTFMFGVEVYINKEEIQTIHALCGRFKWGEILKD